MTSSTTRLHVGQGTHRGPLTVFPIWTDAPSTPRGYLTGASAPVDVAERAGTPAVDQLVLTNRGERPVLLLAGELLEGGWQTRALTATTLLAPGTPSVERVVCVEEGRWGGDLAHARKARRVPFAVRARFDRPDAQQAVWERVSRYDAVAGPSHTGSLADRLDRTAPAARDLTRGLRPSPGSAGSSSASPAAPLGWRCSTAGGRSPSTGRVSCTRQPSTAWADRPSARRARRHARSPNVSKAPGTLPSARPVSAAGCPAAPISAWTTSAGTTAPSTSPPSSRRPECCSTRCAAA